MYIEHQDPGSCLDTVSKSSADILEKSKNNKAQMVCGDINIDLLSPHGNVKITDFINFIYSNSLFPVIIKPTRITTNTATLIYGVLINDVTDHLPVFPISYFY